ncbi:hypothetical protein [Bacillus norwichensis]|uniref:Lipoprotein n=1 Tax=Bacillus norwichensis TaxID=2762217 RepID=A0ABR8VQC6_9BACI|nr:hypothetical protein [Bacillus norwichensis]MBD8006968.1 hypothetical protein [Bacillus norwichensis]
MEGFTCIKKNVIILIIILLSFIGCLHLKNINAGNKVEQTKIIESKASWSVELEQQKSKEPDLYQAYKIKVKNTGKTTTLVEINVTHPFKKDAKVIFPRETSELGPGKTYEMGEIYAMNNHPQKYIVDLIWEEKNIQFEETFTVGK